MLGRGTRPLWLCLGCEGQNCPFGPTMPLGGTQSFCRSPSLAQHCAETGTREFWCLHYRQNWEPAGRLRHRGQWLAVPLQSCAMAVVCKQDPSTRGRTAGRGNTGSAEAGWVSNPQVYQVLLGFGVGSMCLQDSPASVASPSPPRAGWQCLHFWNAHCIPQPHPHGSPFLAGCRPRKQLVRRNGAAAGTVGLPGTGHSQ